MVGLTVIVNVSLLPLHEIPLFVNIGVTVIFAISGPIVLFEVVKLMSPVPDVASPIVGLSFVHS